MQPPGVADAVLGSSWLKLKKHKQNWHEIFCSALLPANLLCSALVCGTLLLRSAQLSSGLLRAAVLCRTPDWTAPFCLAPGVGGTPRDWVPQGRAQCKRGGRQERV